MVPTESSEPQVSLERKEPGHLRHQNDMGSLQLMARNINRFCKSSSSGKTCWFGGKATPCFSACGMGNLQIMHFHVCLHTQDATKHVIGEGGLHPIRAECFHVQKKSKTPCSHSYHSCYVRQASQDHTVFFAMPTLAGLAVVCKRIHTYIRTYNSRRRCSYSIPRASLPGVCRCLQTATP